MKFLSVLVLTLVSVTSFAQSYPPGTRGNPSPRPNTSTQPQVITVQPGTSTYVQAYMPTQVYCEYAAPAPAPVPEYKVVQFFTGSDSCGNGMVAEVRFSGNYTIDQETCRMKTSAIGNINIWSVRVDNRCVNIADMGLSAACASQM